MQQIIQNVFWQLLQKADTYANLQKLAHVSAFNFFTNYSPPNPDVNTNIIIVKTTVITTEAIGKSLKENDSFTLLSSETL